MSQVVGQAMKRVVIKGNQYDMHTHLIEARLMLGLSALACVLAFGKFAHTYGLDPEVMNRKYGFEDADKEKETTYGRWFSESAFRRWATPGGGSAGVAESGNILPNTFIASLLFGSGK